LGPLRNASSAANTRTRLAATFFQASAALQKNYTSSTSQPRKTGSQSHPACTSVDFAPEPLTSYPVATKMNCATFDEPAAIAPLEPAIQ
jgi:hypothetical protein